MLAKQSLITATREKVITNRAFIVVYNLRQKCQKFIHFYVLSIHFSELSVSNVNISNKLANTILLSKMRNKC